MFLIILVVELNTCIDLKFTVTTSVHVDKY